MNNEEQDKERIEYVNVKKNNVSESPNTKDKIIWGATAMVIAIPVIFNIKESISKGSKKEEIKANINRHKISNILKYTVLFLLAVIITYYQQSYSGTINNLIKIFINSLGVFATFRTIMSLYKDLTRQKIK